MKHDAEHEECKHEETIPGANGSKRCIRCECVIVLCRPCSYGRTRARVKPTAIEIWHQEPECSDEPRQLVDTVSRDRLTSALTEASAALRVLAEPNESSTVVSMSLLATSTLYSVLSILKSGRSLTASEMVAAVTANGEIQ